MPIRPENKALYPPNWKSEIVPMIRERSGNRCECTGQCGVNHPDNVLATGNMDEPDRVEIIEPKRCGKWNGMPIDEIEGPKIVLTVAHLNHNPQECAGENLLHMCQACHNRYDAPVRAAGRMARARAQRAIGDLFCEE